MSFTNPYSTKTAGVSTITAAETNAAGAILASCIDPVGGGTYTPVAPIIIGGAQGLHIASGSVLNCISGCTTTLAGTTTAADLTMTGTSKVKLASRSIGPRVQKAVPTTNDPTTWQLQLAGLYMQQIANAKDYVIFPLDVPDGATLTSVRAHVMGAAGHGALPVGADLPEVAVHEIPTDGNSTIVGGSGASDASADVAAYQLKHTIEKTGLSHVIDWTQYRYTVIVGSETGANYVAGLRVYAVDCTYTVTAMDDG